jgi:HAD superfamily hydrolase (TIGR01509 family)
LLPDAMIFDLDGTVADTESIEYRSVAGVWADHHLAFSEQRWAHVIGQSWSPEWVGELQLAVRTRDGSEPSADDLHRRQHDYKAVLLKELVPRPGIVELLDAARHADIPLGIASNSPLRWVETRLAQLGLTDRFAVISAVDLASHPKPHPAPYLEACEFFGARPSHSIAFEDSTTGTASAVAAGLFTIVCPGPLTRGHDLGLAHLEVSTHEELSLASICTAFDRWVTASAT